MGFTNASLLTYSAHYIPYRKELVQIIKGTWEIYVTQISSPLAALLLWGPFQILEKYLVLLSIANKG